MRFLIVTSTRPWAKTGGARRIRASAKALARLGTVDLVVFRYGGAPPLAEDPPEGPFARVLPLPDAGTIDKNRAQLERELPRWTAGVAYDLIWLDREKMWLTAEGLVPGRTVVDVDDLEDVVLERWLAIDRDPDGGALNPQRRVELESLVGYWRSVHFSVAQAADMLVFSSRRDRDRFAFPASHVVPNTYEREPDGDESVVPDLPGEVILFQGWLEWNANEDAALWFAEHVLPRIRSARPQATLVLVGKPSPAVAALARLDGVLVTGEVPRVTPYLARARLVVVPLRVGGGTRIKILEAFAHGVPVISTRIGCEGLAVNHGDHLMITDEPGDFAAQVVNLLADDERGRALAQRAAALFAAEYGPDAADDAIRALVGRVAHDAEPSRP